MKILRISKQYFIGALKVFLLVAFTLAHETYAAEDSSKKVSGSRLLVGAQSVDADLYWKDQLAGKVIQSKYKDGTLRTSIKFLQEIMPKDDPFKFYLFDIYVNGKQIGRTASFQQKRHEGKKYIKSDMFLNPDEIKDMHIIHEGDTIKATNGDFALEAQF